MGTLIEKIRDKTGFSKEECKKALLYSNNDFDKACDLLRDIAVGRTSFYDIELKQYKDIEEELSIDLITLFKSLKNGFYYHNNNGNIVHTSDTESYIFLSAKSCLPNQMCIEVDFGNLETMYFYFQDYGKTWALTEEELL